MFLDRRLLELLEGVRLRIALSALLGLVAVAAGIARLVLSGVVIAQVLQGASPAVFMPLLAMAAGAIVLRALFQFWRDMLSRQTAALAKTRLRRRMYAHAVALGPGYFNQQRTGHVSVSLADGVENLDAFLGQYLPQLMVAGLTPVLLFVCIGILDVQLALIYLAFALCALLAPNLLRGMKRRSSSARHEAYSQLSADFLDSVQGLPTLKAFSQSGARGLELAEGARHLYRATMWVLGANAGSTGLATFCISAGAATALSVGAVKVSQGQMTLETLVVVLMLGVEVFRPLRELLTLYHRGMNGLAAAKGIFALLDAPVTITAPEQRPAQGLLPEVRFEGVTFGYQDGARPALQGMSFTIPAGQTIGLVGPSGAGKSTVVNLLLRFFDPQQGRITLGGADIRTLPLDFLREQVAVVTQDTYLFHGTVAENLRLGKPDATAQELEAAARAANAHVFITALPQGYDTLIGERGARLSGGQRQRIAVARALLKGSPIIVLDEATSSVDAENEAIIQEAIDRVRAGRTTLVIAHRLSTLAGADRIVVLDGGRVVETGTHQELMAVVGTYHRLAALQQREQEAESGLVLPDDIATEKLSAIEETSARISTPAADLAESASPPMGALRVWRRVLALVRPWAGQVAGVFGLVLGHQSLVVIYAFLGATIVAHVVSGQNVTPLLFGLGGVVLLGALLSWGDMWVAHDLAYRLLAEIRIDLYARLDPLAPGYMVHRRSGDLISLVASDVETIERFIAHTIIPLVVSALVAVAVLGALMSIAWLPSVALLPFLALVALSPSWAQRTDSRLGSEVRRKLGVLHSYVVDSIQGLREIVSYGRGEARINEMAHTSQELTETQLRLIRQQASQVAAVDAVTAFGGLIVLAIAAFQVAQGDISRLQLPLLSLLALTAFGPVSDISKTVTRLSESLAAARRLFVVHDEPVTVTDGQSIIALGAVRRALPPTVKFDHVTFTYGPAEPPALQDVSFTVEPGKTVALVGRSGAGKTTAAYLLLRFWDPQSGRIRLAGHDVRDLPLDALRAQIAWVSQDTYLFNATVRENLRLGRPDASDREIEEAARLANAHEFIAGLPQGYETVAGERGVQLSGGQRQRLAVARALLKNAPVLVLDEATSHLDAENEHLLQEALERLRAGRTTVVISHRLSTIRDADRIVVLDEGRLVETGTHQTLLSKGGLYAHLMARQLTLGRKVAASNLAS